MSKNLKQVSRENWNTTRANPTSEQIQTGCLQRIADATELIAKNYVQLIDEVEKHKAQANRNLELLKTAKEENASLKRSIKAYKSHVKRLKNKIEEFESEQAASSK